MHNLLGHTTLDFSFTYDEFVFEVHTLFDHETEDFYREVRLLNWGDNDLIFTSIDDAVIWIEAQVINQSPEIYFGDRQSMSFQILNECGLRELPEPILRKHG